MHCMVCLRRRSLSHDCRASSARPFLQDLLQRRRQVLRGVLDASVRRLGDLFSSLMQPRHMKFQVDDLPELASL
jgi:hypothetical protein